MNALPTTGLSGVTPADLSWLAGAWQGWHASDPIEEVWSAPAGGALMAMFRWLNGEQVRFYEFMTLEATPDEQVLLRIKHFNPGLVGWEERALSADFLLVQLSSQEAVFYQVSKAGPWLVYRLDSPDKLLVYFVRGDQPPDPASFFVYTRQQI